MAHRFSGPGQPYDGLTRLTAHGPKWTGEVRLVEDMLTLPLRWRKPRRVFVNSMSDLFHAAVPDEFIDRLFAVMWLSRRHTFQVLTKRSDRMRRYAAEMVDADRWDAARKPLYDAARGRRDMKQAEYIGITGAHPTWPLPNVWIGVSVENQDAWEDRTFKVGDEARWNAWLSCEPLLGPIDFHGELTLRGIQWVVVGGESGPGARRCEMEWLHSIVEQCAAEGVPCYVKQLGSCHRHGRQDKAGTNMLVWPLRLRVRQFPESM